MDLPYLCKSRDACSQVSAESLTDPEVTAANLIALSNLAIAEAFNNIAQSIDTLAIALRNQNFR